MSIIFEALKKIEEKKGEGEGRGSSIPFSPAEGASLVEAPRSRLRKRVIWIAGGAAAVFAAALLARPDLFGVSPSSRIPAEPAASPAQGEVLKVVSVKPKVMVPFGADGLSKKGAPDSEGEGGGETSLPDLQLKGISRSGRRSWAFIDEKMLRVGDSIKGAELVEILDDRVKLRFRGVEFTLGY